MKKVFLAALMFVAMTGLLRAADEFVRLDSLESSGAKITYDWKLEKVEIKNKYRSAKVMLNYPYVISNGKMFRIDTPPYLQDGVLFISSNTAATIKAIVFAEVDNTIASVQEIITPQDNSINENEQNVPIFVQTPAIGIIAQTTKKASARKLIVLDPGHGGNDPGATGYNGLREKDVVLSVAQLVKQHLRDYNADILLTRNTDDFITLKNRAVFANVRKADLFVSIHCNASDNRSAAGTRSYIYDRVASSKEASEAAKFENKRMGAFDFLMNDLRKSAYEYLSIEAAGNIQQNLISGLRLKWLPTERAPFYVIANTYMPSVLVEIAFISNPKEEQKLDNADFKDKVAMSIANGIIQYLAKIQ
ncbi:MAG: N-acetylmuramoyl-L-alanine amidase [bacterium]